MRNKTNFKNINRSVFILVVLTAVITVILTIYDLYNAPAFGESAQSRVGLHWGTLNITLLLAILIISVFLAISWKRLFLYNVPIAIILVGLCYVLFFLTFTIGWIGFQGILGFLIAFFIGVTLMIFNSISFFIQRHKDTN